MSSKVIWRCSTRSVGAVCADTGLGGASFVSDPTDLAPGDGRWILVRATDGCEGDFGTDSAGMTRDVAPVCP